MEEIREIEDQTKKELDEVIINEFESILMYIYPFLDTKYRDNSRDCRGLTLISFKDKFLNLYLVENLS